MKEQLDWKDIRLLGKSDGIGRWYPDPRIASYFSHIRSPSRAWPWSYAKAAQTQKFAKWLKQEHPELAEKFKEES